MCKALKKGGKNMSDKIVGFNPQQAKAVKKKNGKVSMPLLRTEAEMLADESEMLDNLADTLENAVLSIIREAGLSGLNFEQADLGKYEKYNMDFEDIFLGVYIFEATSASSRYYLTVLIAPEDFENLEDCEEMDITLSYMLCKRKSEDFSIYNFDTKSWKASTILECFGMTEKQKKLIEENPHSVETKFLNLLRFSRGDTTDEEFNKLLAENKPLLDMQHQAYDYLMMDIEENGKFILVPRNDYIDGIAVGYRNGKYKLMQYVDEENLGTAWGCTDMNKMVNTVSKMIGFPACTDNIIVPISQNAFVRVDLERGLKTVCSTNGTRQLSNNEKASLISVDAFLNSYLEIE